MPEREQGAHRHQPEQQPPLARGCRRSNALRTRVLARRPDYNHPRAGARRPAPRARSSRLAWSGEPPQTRIESPSSTHVARSRLAARCSAAATLRYSSATRSRWTRARLAPVGVGPAERRGARGRAQDERHLTALNINGGKTAEGRRRRWATLSARSSARRSCATARAVGYSDVFSLSERAKRRRSTSRTRARSAPSAPSSSSRASSAATRRSRRSAHLAQRRPHRARRGATLGRRSRPQADPQPEGKRGTVAKLPVQLLNGTRRRAHQPLGGEVVVDDGAPTARSCSGG